MRGHLLEEMIEKMPELEKAQPSFKVPLIFYRNVFQTVIAVLEARDAYTAHHSERVATMAERFGILLHLSPKQYELLISSAAVHDVGKVGIPDAILGKEGKLDDPQWEIMKSHPVQGADILLKAARLDNVADCVLHHHERWDGRGYPEGSKGDEIPFISRVIAICDSTDAMMSDRIYRPALGKDNTIQELEKNKNIMYDAGLVKIFIQNWDKIVSDIYDKEN